MSEDKTPKIKNEDKALILAMKFVEELDYIVIGSTFYKYTNGIWEVVTDQELSSNIAHEHRKIIDFGTPTTKQITEVIRNIKDISFQQYSDQIQELKENTKTKNEINLLDGILDLDTLKLREYTKEDFAFAKLPFSYKGEELPVPAMEKFLLSVFELDQVNESTQSDPDADIQLIKTLGFIQEWFGYSLMKGNPLHIAMIMIGDGRNGKGVLMDLWSKIVGINNCSYVDLKNINNEQQLILTKDKLMNFANDIEDGQKLDSGVIKSAIAGELVTGKEIYKKPDTFKFTAKLVFAANELPNIKNTSIAIRQRIHVLPFKKSFTDDEVDINMGKKLEKELEAIFSWAISGLVRLKKRGKFDLPNMCIKALDEYLYSQNPIKLWLHETGIIQEDKKSTTVQVFNHYSDYCRKAWATPVGRTAFYKLLRKEGYETKKTKGYYYVHGIDTMGESIV